MARNPLQAQIQIGRKQLKMEDDDYRALLERATGRSSSADLTDDQRRAVIDAMQALGFTPKAGKRFRPASVKPHVRLIWALWGDLKRRGIWRSPHRSSLLAFVHDRTGVSDPEWLDRDQAQPVIEALKAMGRSR